MTIGRKFYLCEITLDLNDIDSYYRRYGYSNVTYVSNNGFYYIYILSTLLSIDEKEVPVLIHHTCTNVPDDNHRELEM